MGFFHKKQLVGVIMAQQTGKVIPITEIPDPVFSAKTLGDGVAFIPNTNEVFSPVSGIVIQIADTRHAIGIQSDDGLEMLIHLGIDTVELNGEGFTCYVKAGQKVSVGEKLMDMNCKFIASKGYSTISCCIITNMEALKDYSMRLGDASANKTAVIFYQRTVQS